MTFLASPADTAPPATTPLRVLVVEDEPDALASTVESLRLLGHWATGVKSAEVARDRFLDGAFDVLLTDIGLPALSGLDLVQSLPAGQHRIQVIFATGRPPPETPIPGTLWLQKPFSIEQLEAALAHAARDGAPASPGSALPAQGRS